MDTYFSYFCINSSTCNIPGQAKISQLTNFPVAIMYLKAYMGDHNSLFDLIIKRLMDS